MPGGETGTLLVEGESAAAHSWRHHQKTKELMLGEWFNTVNKHYRDKDDYFSILASWRQHAQGRGIWVSPVEVEDALLGHPAVF